MATIVLAVLKGEVDNELGECNAERTALIAACDGSTAAPPTTMLPTTVAPITTTDPPEPEKVKPLTFYFI